MDKYNSQYPYGHYGYPSMPPAPNQPYPPSHPGQYPPPASDRYQYSQYPNYYAPPHNNAYPDPANYAYSAATSAPPAASHGVEYQYQQYPAPPTSSVQPPLQQHNSFQYHYLHHYQQSEFSEKPDIVHSQNSSTTASSSTTNFNHVNDNTPVYPPVYPPIDDMLANVHLSENQPSAPPCTSSVSKPSVSATGFVPNAPQNYQQGATPTTYNGQWAINGPENHSFSGWEMTSPSQVRPSSGPTMHMDVPQNQGIQIVPVTPPKGSLKVLLLHGNLDIWIYEAKNLPNLDMFHKTLGDVFGKLPGSIGKVDGHVGSRITSDPYVIVTVADAAVARTYVISNDENPVWMQHFNVPVAHYAAEIHFVVKDNDVVGSQLIGVVPIPVDQIFGGSKVEGFFPVLGTNRRPCKPGAVLRASIQYTPMQNLSIYYHGVGASPYYIGVPGTYFPLRKGSKVTLYQDAHVPDGYLPHLKLEHGTQYYPGKCWRDIFDAIRQARRLIYITGWSIWNLVSLVRDDPSLAGYKLGELLKRKSQEGVRVLLLVWDDPTSRSILGYKTEGVMGTHDEDTRRYFKHSSVQVLLCPRMAGKRHSWYKQREVGVIYTHHQKSVIVDADAGNNRRRIVAFVGGLDLCNGRYDTPEHPIFRTLQTIHAEDYHNPTYGGNNPVGCPREPWHDLHCRIDGPAAYDVLTNFEERWLKASKPKGLKKLKGSFDDALLRLDRMPEILGPSDVPCVTEDDPECWHVQIFRSIDSNSVKGFPKDPKEAPLKNLVCGKNVLIDMSIHTAYVKAIRSAQHFIYIENQYFIGSSYNWSANKDVGANNLIPMEIALKIAEKIKAHERFAAYIVIPMWPEGNPTGAAVQRILFWQHKTMQMMYETIYKALVEVRLEDTYSPEDFLNFYCLGNREGASDYDTPSTQNHSAATNPQALGRKNRRFMIYVHSKGMIVDDEYVILGSANINERSMEGSRDTEIAMGAYQPHHTWARNQSSPHGQVYGYRMSLWAEHLGVVDECFAQPESLECVRWVRSMGEKNWHQYSAPEVTEMRGHLLKYPVEVDRTGKVKPIPGQESFPDVGGNIVGSFLVIQENLTI